MKITNSAVRLLAGLVCLASQSAASLSACGGGSGGSSGSAGVAGPAPAPAPAPVPSPAGAWLTLTPSTFDLLTYEGEDVDISVTAVSSKTFAKPLNMAIVDAVGVISTSVSVTADSAWQYRANMRSAKTLSIGVHSTNLEVRLCEDDPAVCKTPVAGSPWFVPLKVTVRPATNFTPLRILPQLGAWSTYQGNAAHTGYVAASFDPGKFTRRWKSNGGSFGRVRAALATDNGVVFNVNDFSAGKVVLEAFSEDTGQAIWRVDMGSSTGLNRPAAANGKVFVASTSFTDSFFWVFNGATGALISKTTTGPRGGWLAPTVVGVDAYTGSGASGGMMKFNTITGKKTWDVGLPPHSGSTPAVDASHAFAYTAGSLHALDLADGRLAFKVDGPASSFISRAGRTPMLSGKQMAYVLEETGGLLGFDLASRKLAWSLKLDAPGQPAYANDVVYVLANGSALEARSGSTGAFLWKTNLLIGPGPEPDLEQVIVTDNLAFVTSSRRTLAIDLKTHQTVWSYALGGSMSISDRGVLYLLSPNGDMAAINLQ